MLNRPLDALTSDDILGLVADGISEGRQFELKSRLPGRADKDPREFAADVTAFANAQGGDIVYGVEEKGGLATGVIGLEIDNRVHRRPRLWEHPDRPAAYSLRN